MDRYLYPPRMNLSSRISDPTSSQNVLNLSASPPTLECRTASPPIYSAEGGVFHNGLVYYKTSATSGISTPLLNNYFGWSFNGIGDLTVDPVYHDIWFTDNA
ncbi:hypothetical protein BDZ45DRAFT_743451 [Acephala macrosclerotiorum]|nr:hypothetical protein BDZ45DRAFT_743451 [Acephala macrosclerotiorum]